MIVNPFREPAMRRMLGLACCMAAAQMLGLYAPPNSRSLFWFAWGAFGMLWGLLLLFYSPTPKELKRWRHPAWKEVPPGYCPICGAKPREDCDSGLHS